MSVERETFEPIILYLLSHQRCSVLSALFVFRSFVLSNQYSVADRIT
jgi:hypothetical protein